MQFGNYDLSHCRPITGDHSTSFWQKASLAAVLSSTTIRGEIKDKTATTTKYGLKWKYCGLPAPGAPDDRRTSSIMLLRLNHSRKQHWRFWRDFILFVVAFTTNFWPHRCFSIASTKYSMLHVLLSNPDAHPNAVTATRRRVLPPAHDGIMDLAFVPASLLVSVVELCSLSPLLSVE
jgi:hypothetical protein